MGAACHSKDPTKGDFKNLKTLSPENRKSSLFQLL